MASSSKKKKQLQQRRNPNQERSRDSVKRILKAAADLLVEQGVEKLTTRRIAERAKVNVSTLYQFFPNKQAIVYALYEDWIGAAREVFARADEDLENASGWRPFFIKFITELEDVGFTAELESRLTQAIAVYEYLHRVDKEYMDWANAKIAEYIRHFSPHCPANSRKATAAVILEWDMALVNLEITYTKPVQKKILDMTMEGMLHLLGLCIENKPNEKAP